MTSHRRRAREAALEVLYQCDLVGADPKKLIPQTIRRLRLTAETAAYLKRLVQGVLEHLSQLDESLAATLKHWRLERLSYVDRAILRIAVCEIVYFEDIPPIVSINEAVELAKRFSDNRAGQFVNGVLDAIAKSEEPEASEAVGQSVEKDGARGL